MTLEKSHEPHPGTPWIWRDPDTRWPLHTCSFCGSVTPEDAERLLLREKATASGSDWKYGWPHKFYIGDIDGQRWKFYSEHLTTASNFESLSSALEAILHIGFGYDAVGRLIFRAPNQGYQTWVHEGIHRGLPGLAPKDV